MSDGPPYKLSTSITFLPKDMLLQIASGYLIAWASQIWANELARDTQMAWLKNFFFKKFQEHFEPDVNVNAGEPAGKPLTITDLSFKYRGDGYFIPRSQQGLIATEDHYDDSGPPVTTITFLFDVEYDGNGRLSMHTLHITYEGRDKYKLRNVRNEYML